MISQKTLEQLEMLRLLALAERKIVAEQMKISVGALDSRIFKFRQKVLEARYLIKEVEKLERVYPHIKRAMLPTKMEEEQE